MRIYSVTQSDNPNGRYSLLLTADGVVCAYERAAVGGGWYTNDSVTVPWPWKRR